MVDELSRGIKALASMAEEARCVGFQVEIHKEGAIYHRQTTVKDVKAVLQFNCQEWRREPTVIS